MRYPQQCWSATCALYLQTLPTQKPVSVSLKNLGASGFNSPLEYVGTGECKDCFDWEKSAGKEGRNRRVAFPGKQTDFCFRERERERERRLSDCLSAFCGSRWRKRQFQKLQKHIQKPPELWGREEVQSRLWINKQSQGDVMLAEALQFVYTCPIWKITNTWDGMEHGVQGFSNSWLTNVMLFKHGFSRVTADWTVYNVHYYHSVRVFDAWKTFGKF